VEIVDFLGAARRRLWVLLGVPVLAAVATTALVLSAPTKYTATTTVTAPALVGGAEGNQYTGSQAVGQYAAAFQAIAAGPAVRREVSEQTGIPAGRIGEGTTVEQVGASSVMIISYVDTDRAMVTPVAQAVTEQTLKTLFASQVTLAKAQVESTRKSLGEANAAIASWEKKNRMVDPDRVYSSTVDQINSLTQQQASLRANGNLAGAAALDASIATARSGMSKFGPLLAEYHTLTASRDSLVATLTATQQRLQSALGQQGAADPAVTTFTSGDRAVNPDAGLLTKVLPVTGAAVFAAVALVVILEMLSRSRALARLRRPGQPKVAVKHNRRVGDRFPEPARARESVVAASGDGGVHRG
jgi:uncharacterized protein involved in exopolysaccharide biosynthesis